MKELHMDGYIDDIHIETYCDNVSQYVKLNNKSAYLNVRIDKKFDNSVWLTIELDGETIIHNIYQDMEAGD